MLRSQIQKAENGYLVIITTLNYDQETLSRQPRESMYVFKDFGEVVQFLEEQK